MNPILYIGNGWKSPFPSIKKKMVVSGTRSIHLQVTKFISQYIGQYESYDLIDRVVNERSWKSQSLHLKLLRFIIRFLSCNNSSGLLTARKKKHLGRQGACHKNWNPWKPTSSARFGFAAFKDAIYRSWHIGLVYPPPSNSHKWRFIRIPY